MVPILIFQASVGDSGRRVSLCRTVASATAECLSTQSRNVPSPRKPIEGTPGSVGRRQRPVALDPSLTRPAPKTSRTTTQTKVYARTELYRHSQHGYSLLIEQDLGLFDGNDLATVMAKRYYLSTPPRGDASVIDLWRHGRIFRVCAGEVPTWLPRPRARQPGRRNPAGRTSPGWPSWRGNDQRRTALEDMT